MAFVARGIRPSGVCVTVCLGNGGSERGAFSWPLLGNGIFVCLKPQSALQRYGAGASSSLVGVAENLGFRSTHKVNRRKQQQRRSRYDGSWLCFYCGAHSQVQETESGRKERKVTLKKGRKSRIESESDAEDSGGTVPATNGFSPHPESRDDREETPLKTDQPVERKRNRKKQESGGQTAPAPRMGGRKKADSLESGQGQDSYSDVSDSDAGNSDTDSPTELGFRGRYDPTITNGEMRQASEDFTGGVEIIVGQEIDHRFLFLESLMERARSGDLEGVEEVLSEMEIAGIKAGSRAYHGLVVTYTRALDAEGAVQALRREIAAVERPLPETFAAMARMFGRLGQAHRGEEILAVMEKLKHDPRVAWLILVEEVKKSGHLQEANDIFFKGAYGGIKATPELYNVLVEENAKAGDHGNAVNVVRSLEYAGFQPTTFHHNCLLMCQANANVPEVAASTFEEMQYGPDAMKPDTESYNWLLQAHIRHEHGDRCQDVVDLVGEMVEDNKRVQPNMRTYCLLVECFTKYNVANEAVRHFRALSRLTGGLQYLHNEGKSGDPLSLYLRALCLEGRAKDILEATEAMLRDKQQIPTRAMFTNLKGRTLVSSWIEPIGAEADLGYEVDYISRYLTEGGGMGTRKRWSDLNSGSENSDGFAFSAPVEVSFKQHCAQIRRRYILRLIRKLRSEGVLALGPGATDEDVVRIMVKLRKEIVGDMIFQPKKPKAASKMLVSELKEELEAQGLPIDGTRPVLYQRVQKARRINRARGRPLWVPPETEEEHIEEDEDERIELLLGQLTLENDHTEFWKKRLIGEDQETELFQVADSQARATMGEEGDSDFGEEEEEDTDEEIEDTEENEDLADDGVEDDGGEDEDPEALELLALKLMNKKVEVPAEEQVLDDKDSKEGRWLGLTLQQKIAKLRNEKLLDPSEMYTIADVWGWTWEREIRAKEPERWTQELEVQTGMQIMQMVVELGGTPTIGDCAMLVHAAMRIPWPEAIVTLIQQTHKIGYRFGSKLYNDIVKLFISVGEKDAAIAVITDMEDVGLSAPGDLINAVLMESERAEKQEISS